MSYYFLYDASGSIVERGKRDITDWVGGYYNPSAVGSLIIPETDATAQNAINNPSHYLIINGTLVAQPYFSVAYTSGTVTATLNNPPTTPPTEATFAVAGQTYSETITSGQATLALAVHPSVANQTINVTVSAAGCVDGSINIGGSATDISDFQVVTPSGGTATVGPAGSGAIPYLQQFYTVSASSIYAALTNMATADSLMADWNFRIQPAGLRLLVEVVNYLTGLSTNPLVLSSDLQTDLTTIDIANDANASNVLAEIAKTIMPALWTTLDNAYPSGGQKQMQFAALEQNFQAGGTNVSDFMAALELFGLTAA